jgi:tRNA(Ile)-lysidine synthase
MRADQADHDVETLQRWCEAAKLTIRIAHANVPALAKQHSISVEEAGREARYTAFAEAAAEIGANKVATAHNADDQVETILFRLLRGTGVDGLAGIPERRPLSSTPGAPEVIRPLLSTSRAEIEAYVREHALQPLEDSTNQDLRYQRSRIRLQLLPELEEQWPNLRRNLLRLADQAREEGAFLDALAAPILQTARRQPDLPWPWSAHWQTSKEAQPLRIEILRDAPRVLCRRALLRAIREACGYEAEIDRALLERAETLLTGGGALQIPGADLRLRAADGMLQWEPTATEPTIAPREIALPGVTDAAEWRIRVLAEEAGPPIDPKLPPVEAILEQTALQGPLHLRPPQRGDRFHPLNAPGNRLLSDLFLDRKIPARDRPNWPVFEDTEGIVWVPGVALAHRARVHSTTTRCWRLRLVPAIGS